MIELSNGHRFNVAAAAGTFGFDGDDAGHGLLRLWKRPWRWLGLIDPGVFTVILKTVTWAPRRGNLRWYCPWTCVARIRDGGRVRGYVNHVGLTNPGFEAWERRFYPVVVRRGYRAIASIFPESLEEAAWMASRLDRMAGLVGLELNLSCPNAGHEGAGLDETRALVQVVRNICRLPLFVKLGWSPSLTAQACVAVAAGADVLDLINTVPWPDLFPGPSPLARWGRVGGVSGCPLAEHARRALQACRSLGLNCQFLSGGGIYDGDEASLRLHKLGADAVSIGSWCIHDYVTPTAVARALNHPACLGEPDRHDLTPV